MAKINLSLYVESEIKGNQPINCSEIGPISLTEEQADSIVKFFWDIEEKFDDPYYGYFHQFADKSDDVIPYLLNDFYPRQDDPFTFELGYLRNDEIDINKLCALDILPAEFKASKCIVDLVNSNVPCFFELKFEVVG